MKRYEAVMPVLMQKKTTFLAESIEEARELMDKYLLLPHEEWIVVRSFLIEERDYETTLDLDTEEVYDGAISVTLLSEG